MVSRNYSGYVFVVANREKPHVSIGQSHVSAMIARGFDDCSGTGGSTQTTDIHCRMLMVVTPQRIVIITNCPKVVLYLEHVITVYHAAKLQVVGGT